MEFSNVSDIVRRSLARRRLSSYLERAIPTVACIGALGCGQVADDRPRGSMNGGSSSGGSKSTGNDKGQPGGGSSSQAEAGGSSNRPAANGGDTGGSSPDDAGTEIDGNPVTIIPDADCEHYCKTFVANKCETDTGFDEARCHSDCRGPDDAPKQCGDLMLALFACIEEKLPIACRSNGTTAILCGPCDNELRALGANCGIDLDCLFQ